jgi:Tfp pilus assembly protein PilN
MIRLNMLPDVKREYLHARRLESKVVAGALLLSAIAIGLVVLIALYVYGAQTLQKNGLTSKINSQMSELKEIKDIDKYVTIQNQLGSISSLHEKKLLYSRLFTILPKLNPAAPHNVKITNLTVDSAENTIMFEGETSSFTALETFRDTLKNARLLFNTNESETMKDEGLFSSVVIDTQAIGKATNGATVVTFKLTTSVNTGVFARTTKSYDVTVPNKETTQSKEDAPDVFGKSTTVEGQ